MGYSLHIELEDSEIELEEWISVIESIDKARIQIEGAKAVNPKTGEEIIIESSPGDVEVLFIQKSLFGFSKKSSWELCFWFSHGKASFNATEDIDSPGNPVRQVAAEAAKALSAKIVGDEGEVYSW